MLKKSNNNNNAHNKKRHSKTFFMARNENNFLVFPFNRSVSSDRSFALHALASVCGDKFTIFLIIKFCLKFK